MSRFSSTNVDFYNTASFTVFLTFTRFISKIIFMVPVQFITHQTERYTYEESAMLALQGGCKWIQLRMKDAEKDSIIPIARRLKEACRLHEATFIIDDWIEVAREVGADGVHLGRTDTPVAEARNQLGEDFIIGGTANTLDDIRRLKAESADYIGCGPFRFTETKKNLAPILGLEGYRRIMEGMEEENIRIPVCAIGGIELQDVPAILSTGVRGIAVSSAVLKADDPVSAMNAFIHCV